MNLKESNIVKQVVVLTGGSSGIGRETARVFAAAGYRVFEISRRDIPQDRVIHITADITNEGEIRAALSEIHRIAGRIDIVINNAGTGISGAVEYTSTEMVKQLFDVNFFGAVSVTRLAIPYLRETRGRIVNVGSVAGIIAIPFQAYYAASKAALLSLTESLRAELYPFGITATCLLPGDAQTGFTAARHRLETGDELYGGRIARSVAAMEKDEQNGMSPASIAAQIHKAATRRRVAPAYTIGAKYKFFVFLTRVLPRSTVNWLVRKIYAD